MTSRVDVGDLHAARLGRGDHQVAHVQEADDVVLRAAHHRVAAVRLLDGLLDGRLTVTDASRNATSVRGSITSRSWRSPGGEDLVDELALVLGERLVRRHHVAQLLLGDGPRPARWGHPGQPYDEVGALAEQPDDRPEQRGDAVDQRGEPLRRALRALQAQALGGELAEHQRGVGDEQDDHDERRAVGQPARHAGPRVVPQRADSRLAPKAADRKPARVTPICTAARKRLGSLLSLATRAPRRPRSAIAFTCDSRRRHDARSRGGEDAADEGEREHDRDVGQDVAHGVPCPSPHQGRGSRSTPSYWEVPRRPA
jgi:hypothetical protein